MKTTLTRILFWAIRPLCLFVLISSATASPVVIAHRGFSAIAPENTISAITAAGPYAWGCEIDIRETADGEYILMHDETVDHTTNGTGKVNALSYSYIRGLDAGSWKSPEFAGEQVPNLMEAINAAMANDLKLCVEIKAASAMDMYALLQPYSEYIELHSFHWDLLQDIADLDTGGDFTYVAIGSNNVEDGNLDQRISTLPECIDKVSWGRSGVTASSISTLHSMDKMIYAWTVNSVSTALNFAAMGVDGIITDSPATINYALNPPDIPEVSYPCQLKDDLAAYWKFDEGLTNPSTRIAADSSGNGNDATFKNTLSVPDAWKTGGLAKVGGAIQLDGNNDTTESISGEALDLPKRGVTISTWVKLDELPTQMSTDYGSIYDSATDAYVLYLDKSSGELRMKITTDAGTSAKPGIPQWKLNTYSWQHVVGVYDGGAGTAQIYLNGELVDIEANAGVPLFGLIGSQIATIGSSAGSDFFDGKLDEMAIWGRALGQAEIDYLYNAGQGQAIPAGNTYIGAPTPTVQYRFEGNLSNSGSGGTAYDATFVNGAQGTTTFVTGIEGDQAIRTTNSHVNTNHDYLDTSYQLTETGAITFWCKPTSYYDYNSLFDTSGEANDWEMWIYNSGLARFRIDDDSVVSAQLGSAGEWYHLAVTWARQGSDVLMSIYLDGVRKDFDVGSWTDPASTFYLFGGNTENMGANVSFDDFRIYDSLLTSDEIMAIYLQKEQPPIPGDANGDGKVDGSDVTILADNWQAGVPGGNSNVTWGMGDFNGDHMVDGSDVTILADNWQFGVIATAASVPEPSTTILLIFTALFGWMVRKHRTNRN